MGGNGLMLSAMQPVDPSPARGKTTPPTVPGQPGGYAVGDPPEGTVPASLGGGVGPTEVPVEGRGGRWWARVTGRAGRARAGAPLLMLGFRLDGETVPTLEALVAGRSLGELSLEVLESALERAAEPAPADRRRPFFEDSDDARRT